MRAKAGVDLSTLRPEIRRLEPLIDAVYAEMGVTPIVTCTDGDHEGRKSYHNVGLALDLRVKHVGGAKKQAVLHALLERAIDQAYPRQYDVILEYPGGENAHIHIECSPVLAAALHAVPSKTPVTMEV